MTSVKRYRCVMCEQPLHNCSQAQLRQSALSALHYELRSVVRQCSVQPLDNSVSPTCAY